LELLYYCCLTVQKEQIIFLIVLFVAIVVGNMAIFLSIVMAKSGKRSRMKYFIMHLAIAGLYAISSMFRTTQSWPRVGSVHGLCWIAK